MYERTSQIRAERLATDGIIEGVLATNGEATDGHILNVRGIEATPGAPLLFGHDAHSGRNNLGSWVNFTQRGQRQADKGGQQLHGTAQIELGGSGAQAEFRQDVAHMVGEGHIGSFSIRWDAVGEVVARTDLPAGHFAHAGKDSSPVERSGLYFERSRLLEGSVVTIGADKTAVVARAIDSQARSVWADLMGADLLEEVMCRVSDLQERIGDLERAEPLLPDLIVPGDVTPARTEEVVTSTERTPESLPAKEAGEVFIQGLEERLAHLGEKLDSEAEAMIQRIIG